MIFIRSYTNFTLSIYMSGLIVPSVSAAECVSCILWAVWTHECVACSTRLCPQRCAVSPLLSSSSSCSLWPAFIHYSDHRAWNSDIGLLLTPAISSTLLRNALSFPEMTAGAYRRIDSQPEKCFPVKRTCFSFSSGSAAVMNSCLVDILNTYTVASRLRDNDF